MIPIQNHQHFNFRFNQHFMNSKPYQIDWNVNLNEHKLSQSISSLCSAFTFCFLFGCFCEKHVKKRIIFRMLKHSKVVCETKMAHERLFLKSARMQFESFFLWFERRFRIYNPFYWQTDIFLLWKDGLNDFRALTTKTKMELK